MFTYWLLLAFLLFCLGDIFSFYEMQKTFWCCSGLFLLFEIVCLCKKYNKEYLFCGLCCFLVLAGGFMTGTGKLETQKRWQKLFEKQIILQGAVEPDSIRKKEQGIGALLAAEYPLHGKVRIFVKTDPKNADLTMRKLRSGRIGLTGVLKEPVFLRNPGTYDGYLFNKIKGIHGNLTVSPAQLHELGEPLPLRFRFTALAQKVRENALVQLHISAGAILPGMVLGGYQGVGPEEADVFRDNGIAHLLAVSGTHVAVLAMIL
ncbi:MAG: ComEC/Rec2 family competence protein [Acidaminococcaceae bacterium]|nr:ComEC/Rec2 family competence protein [Acidaminococcaceae bacterium]